jgi:site-specific DNA-cytosine methylase/intein/homing endonuclease
MGKKIKIVTLCSGYDSQCMALDVIKQKHPDFDYDLVAWSEIDKYAIQMHNLVYPQYASRNLGDMTKIDWQPVKDKYGEIDFLTYSTPCFVEGTLVLTDKGYMPIEGVQPGDRVLTHTNAYQTVLKVGHKALQPVIRVKGMCIDEIVCTPNHPFYVREMFRSGHKWERAFGEPEWKAAEKLTKTDYLGIAVNTLSVIPEWGGTIRCYGGRSACPSNRISAMLPKEDYWYLMGRYVGDGWSDEKYNRVMIACSDRNEETLKETLSRLGYRTSAWDKEKTSRKYTVSSKELVEFVARYGQGAGQKRIDGETLALPRNLLEAFLRGYTESDGCLIPQTGEYKITTISPWLAYALPQIVAKVHHRPARLYKVERPGKYVIEGREVNQHDFYQVSWHTDDRKQDKAFYENGYIWFPCNGIETVEDRETVYNMEIENDNSYTANGVIVHNCQDISQAGKQKGLEEGSGTRSAILWSTEEAIRILRPKYLLQENVKAIISGYPDFFRKGKDGKKVETFWSHLHKWIKRVESYGYQNTWSIVNAKDMGVPQNRERFFLLSQRNDIAKPYKWPNPMPLERKLADVLEEEVDERYFLKDDAVAKFLKANEKDPVVFMQFPLAPTHKNAMFLKTWLHRICASHDLWTAEDHTYLVKDIEDFRQDLMADYDKFMTDHESLGQEFLDEFNRNMEKKQNEF